MALVAAGSVVFLSFRADVTGSSTAQLLEPRADGVTPLVTERFDGADARRLPTELQAQWEANLAGIEVAAAANVRVAPNGDVVGIFALPDVDDRAVVIALDGGSGVERWRTEIESSARSFDILGVIGDVVVLERLDTENRSVVGISLLDGELRWERVTADPGVHVLLHGTSVVARVSFTANERLTFIDPVTGEEVGRVPGRLLATDYRGTWYVRSGRRVSRLDLRDGWLPPVLLERELPDAESTASIIDERLVVRTDAGVDEVDGGTLRSLSISADVRVSDGEEITADVVRRFNPMVDGAFVFSGLDRVYGAQLDGDDIVVRWAADGAAVDVQPTDDGLAVRLAEDGGASQRIINASTGDEIVQVPILPGAFDNLEIVANGIVVKQAAAVGFERVAFDLDGNRLWALLGEGPIAIGPEVVVAYGSSPDGATITLYASE